MGKEKISHWYPRWPADLLADVSVSAMSLEQQGAYGRLMDYNWIEGTLPASPEALARLCCVTTDHFETAIWPALDPHFDPAPGAPERITNRRMARERKQQIAAYNRRSNAGKRGRRKQLSEHNIAGPARAMPGQCSGKGVAIAGQIEIEREKEGDRKKEGPSSSSLGSGEDSQPIDLDQHLLIVPDERERADRLFDEFWEAWPKPKRVGKARAKIEFRKLKPTRAMLAGILAAIEQIKTSHLARDGFKFLKDPERWLRERRWEDEVVSPQAEAQKRTAAILDRFVEQGDT